MKLSREFLAFLVTGGVAAVVNFGSRLVFSQWLEFGSAVVLAYFTGMVTAFVLARLFVFTTTGQTVGRSAMWFAVVNLVAVLQTWAVSLVLARWALPGLGLTWHVDELAHAVGIVLPVLTSYFGHKHLSFR